MAPFAEVTRAAAEAPAREVGLAPDAATNIWQHAERLYATGLYPALALCIRRRGQVILDRSIGHAHGNAPFASSRADRVIATPDTLFNLFSASKMVTAMLVHLCDQRGLLRLDDPVAHYLPKFAKHGKGRMTLRHVLTHRAGIPRIPTRFADVGLLSDPSVVLDLLAEQRPLWRPGTRLAYHALTGGYVLGAVVEAVTGKPLREFLAETILRPLGFSHFNYGVPAEEVGQVAQNAFTGPPLWPPVSTLIKRALSVEFGEAVRISNDPRFLTAVVPAGNIIATANEACRFMQLLLNGGELDGVQVFEPRTLARATAEQYFEFDVTLGVPVRYSMGFMLGARWLSVFGTDTSKAFGHLGFTNVFVWADPARQLSVALMTSGKPTLSPRLLRLMQLIQSIGANIPRA